MKAWNVCSGRYSAIQGMMDCHIKLATMTSHLVADTSFANVFQACCIDAIKLVVDLTNQDSRMF